MPQLSALTAAFLFSLSIVIVRLGLLARGSVFQATVVALTSGAIAMAILSLFTNSFLGITPQSTLVFALIGMLGPTLGRYAATTGISTLGASVSGALQGAGYPFFSVLLAALILKEDITAWTAMGAILVTVGVVVVSFAHKDRRQSTHYDRRLLILPLGAGFLFAFSDALITLTYEIFASEILAGASISMLAAWIFYFCLSLRKKNLLLPIPQNAAYLFFLSGLAQAGAVYFLYTALSHGRLALVGPIAGLTPIFTVLVSYLFLQDERKLGLPVMAGGLIITIGVSILMSI